MSTSHFWKPATLTTAIALGGLLTGCAGGPAVGAPASSVAAEDGELRLPATPPPGALPSEVYRLEQAYLAAVHERMEVAEAEAVRLMRSGKQEEFEKVEAELGALLQSRTLAPFYTDSALLRIEEWDDLPVEERLGMYGMVMQMALPSEFEILDETIDGDRATIHVRGHFEDPLMGEPGWKTGEIRFARDDGEWRIAKESWRDS